MLVESFPHNGMDTALNSQGRQRTVMARGALSETEGGMTFHQSVRLEKLSARCKEAAWKTSPLTTRKPHCTVSYCASTRRLAGGVDICQDRDQPATTFMADGSGKWT